MGNDWRSLHTRLKRQGFHLTRTRKNRVRVTRPGVPGTVILPHTVSDHRALKNALTALKRLGYRPPPQN